MQSKIYLDHNATTPIDPQVLENVVEILENSLGNPSSVHSYGQEARSLLTQARRDISNFFHVKPQEVIFCSGGTEALNLMIYGVIAGGLKKHVISSNVEHKAVLNCLEGLKEREGLLVTLLPTGKEGRVSVEQVKAAITSETALITLMGVNNETGVKTDIKAIGELAEQEGVPFLVDGVAMLGKDKLDIPQGVSAICFSGHKCHAPQGIGMIIMRKSLCYRSLIKGGQQEYQKRAGTENLPGIVGLAKALECFSEVQDEAIEHMRLLRDYFEKELSNQLEGVHVNGEGPRTVNTSNLFFEGVEGEVLLFNLDLEGVCASLGSACTSGALEPSHVLLNMGYSKERVAASIRFSLSRFTTKEEIEHAVAVIVRVVTNMRSFKRNVGSDFLR